MYRAWTRFAVLYAFAPILLAPLGMSRGPLRLEAYLANMLVAVAAVPVLDGLHEAGHALVGRLLGGTVTLVQVGRGPALWRPRLAGVQVWFCPIPIGGFTWVRQPAGALWPRGRRWLRTLGGPAVNAGVIAWLLAHEHPAASARWLLGDGLTSGFAPLQAIALTATLRLFAALWPRSQGGDGWQLVALLLGRDDDEPPAAVGPALAAARAELRGGHPDDARRALASLRASRLPAAARLYVDNAYAWTLLFVGDKAAVREARTIAGGLYRSYPGYPWVVGTYGAALVSSGELNLGMMLVHHAYTANATAELRAHNACWLAIGEVRQGRLDDAAGWVDKARQLDRACYSLPLAEHVVAAARGPAAGY